MRQDPQQGMLKGKRKFWGADLCAPTGRKGQHNESLNSLAKCDNCPNKAVLHGKRTHFGGGRGTFAYPTGRKGRHIGIFVRFGKKRQLPQQTMLTKMSNVTPYNALDAGESVTFEVVYAFALTRSNQHIYYDLIIFCYLFQAL